MIAQRSWRSFVCIPGDGEDAAH